MVSSINYRFNSARIKNAPVVLFFLSLFLLLLNSDAAQPTYIRVLVSKNINSINLQIQGSYEILDEKARNILYRGNNLNTTLLGYKDGVLLGQVNLRSDSIFLRSLKHSIIKIDGREFKGGIQILKEKNEKNFLVVNFIELEEYVKGVLYHEISHHWPMEAIKAQAIVSRTFALYQREVNRNKAYDVTADIYSQIYGGKTSERYRTNTAVKETQDRILVYKGKPFLTFFSAACAGHTEAASNLWDIDIEPLKGRECRFCSDAPHFRWSIDMPLTEIKDSLNKSGLGITEDIKNITVISRNKSGRVDQIKIYFGENDLSISAKDFRNAIGPNIIRSTNFDIQINGNLAYLEGFGWGHGVGLCQWGAYFMAKKGYKYDEILKYYYPGAAISLILNL